MLAKFYHILNILHSFLDKSRTDTTENIVEEKTFGSPGLFENRSEHENCKHIKENVAESAVHEHISDKLCRIKVTCEEKM